MHLFKITTLNTLSNLRFQKKIYPSKQQFAAFDHPPNFHFAYTFESLKSFKLLVLLMAFGDCEDLTVSMFFHVGHLSWRRVAHMHSESLFTNKFLNRNHDSPVHNANNIIPSRHLSCSDNVSLICHEHSVLKLCRRYRYHRNASR